MSHTAREKKKESKPETVTRDQARDTGMAMVLLCLLVGYFGDMPEAVLAGIVLQVLNMTHPAPFRPLVKPWLGLSRLLGAMVSRVLLALIFFLVVTPVGVIRRAWGSDSLQLKRWKRGDSSVFRRRDHRYGPKDIEKPY